MKFKIIKNNTVIQTLFVYLFFLFLNTVIYFSVSGVSSTGDQWFYFKIADLIRTNGWGIISSFNWLYFTNLAQDNLNYALTLHHLFLIPFTYIQNNIIGLKFSGAVLASTVPTMVFYTWKKFDILKPFFWSLLFYLFVNIEFLWRTFINRGFVLVDGLILVEIFLLYKEKYWTLFFVAVLHTWWHPGTFWVVPLMALLYESIRYIHTKSIILKNIIAGFIGSCLGFFLYPQHSDQFFSSMNPLSWLKNLTSYFYNINSVDLLRHGSEVYTRDLFTFSSNNKLIAASFLFVVLLNILLYIHRKRNNNKDFDKKLKRVILREFLFLLVLLFTSSFLFISFRFLDLLLPTLFLSLAVSLQLILEHFFAENIKGNYKKVTFIIILIISSYFFINKISDLRDVLDNENKYENYELISKWFENNTQKGEVIFNTEWGQTPILFFYNDWNYYIIGLEPKSLYRYNQELYWIWHNISYYGRVCNFGECKKSLILSEIGNSKGPISKTEEMSYLIKEKFKSQYLFFNRKTYLYNEIKKDKEHYELVYSDEIADLYVYKIR